MKSFKTILLLVTINFMISCSKEEPTSDPQNPGNSELIESPGQITEEDFESFAGEIGLILNARPLVRKGYKPTQVSLTILANSGDFSQTVPIEEHTFMGQLKIPLEGLSDAAKTELTSGVQVTAEYKDENGTTIFTEPAFTYSLQSNPNARTANATTLSETPENQTLSFNQNSSYYIQRMNADGSGNSFAWRHLPGTTYNDLITANNTEFNGNEPDRGFTFIPIPGEVNTFAIRHTASLRYIKVAPVFINTIPFAVHNAPVLSNNTSLTVIQNLSDYNSFKFRFEQAENDTYIITSLGAGPNGLAIKQVEEYGLTVDPMVNANQSEERFWRVISTGIEWNVTTIGTSFLEPVLPKPEFGIQYNSVLTNCGSGALTQTVNSEITETLTTTAGLEESLSMSTSNDISVTAGVNVEFSAELFGVGTTVNASLESTYSHSWSATETSSSWQVENNTTQISLFTSREVIVPSGSASLVYDVQQFYPETKVNFVQRLRVEGTDNGQPLTGNEIRTLFYLTNFTGVITDIEPNSIVVTLKGTITLDKIVKSESNVQDVPANCN
ncbi:hypothetical protein ACU8DI_09460 [Psychroserpens sp. BH13MA-6]